MPVAPPSMTLVGRLAAVARRRGSAPWLVYHDRDGGKQLWSYRDSFDAAGRVANHLARLGVAPGDRVAIVSHNRPEVYLLYLACWLSGVVACPIGVGERPERKRYVLDHAAAGVVAVEPSQRDEIEALAATLASPPKTVPIETLLAASAAVRPLSPIERPAATPAFQVYTSGTTGDPKAVLLDHGNLLSNALATAAWHRLGDGDGLLTVLPIHHVNGAVVTGLTAFLAGGRTLLERDFSPRTFWRRLAEEGAVAASVVPTLLEFLLSADERIDRYDLSRLRYLLCGAGPLLAETVVRFEERFDVAVCHGFGMSETTAYNTQFPMELPRRERLDWYQRHGFPSVGCALACNEVTVLRSGGGEAEALERGEIVVRGPTVMRGYLGDDAANARSFQGGWFLSGDQGFFDLDDAGRRHLFVSGRLKELVVRGGVNLNPLEIDEAIRRFPGVAFALAFGFANRFYGEEVAAFVVPVEGAHLSEAELVAFLAESLPFALRPKALLFGPEVPYTATGKPRRLALAQRLAPQLAHLRDVQYKDMS